MVCWHNKRFLDNSGLSCYIVEAKRLIRLLKQRLAAQQTKLRLFRCHSYALISTSQSIADLEAPTTGSDVFRRRHIEFDPDL